MLHIAYLGDYGDFSQESIERVAEEASRRNCNLLEVVSNRGDINREFALYDREVYLNGTGRVVETCSLDRLRLHTGKGSGREPILMFTTTGTSFTLSIRIGLRLSQTGSD